MITQYFQFIYKKLRYLTETSLKYIISYFFLYSFYTDLSLNNLWHLFPFNNI